jgi:acetylornithine/N-succinyldiaminopimelate aminotransferase
MTTAQSALLEVFKRSGIEPVSGDGMWLTCADGARYLDFYGGHAVALLGNVHPRLVVAMTEQARSLFFQSNSVDLAIRKRAAERLVRFGPKGLTRVFFINSGAEANENALRIAFLTTRRTRVVAVAGSFHGRTAAAGALTEGSEKWYGFPQKPFPVTTVPFNDTAALKAAIGDDVAAVILEPVQGVSGARVMSAEFIETARAVTSERGALLIFDEVQCGMGRSGWPFVAQALGITPDLLTTAKGLAGGLPAGAVLISESLATQLNKGDLGTTFGGGPVICAVIEAVIDVIESENLLPRVRRLSARLQAECLVGPVIGVQGMGYLLGLRTRRPASEVLTELRERHILAGSSNDPQVLRLLPPLILEDAAVDTLVATLKELAP